jgi:TolB-like protein
MLARAASGALDAMSAEQEPALSQASMRGGAVFLSYASEDVAAAERIAVALQSAGIQVWFDREELRGGDTWDRQIRQQIHDCRLFIAMISAQTEARDEGYFRREWRLAVERAGDMAEGRAFLVPVVIDGTTERGAAVPDKFRELQWTRLPDGEASPAFVERVRRLLSPDAPPARTSAPPVSLTSTVRSPGGAVPPPWRPKAALSVTGAVVAAAVAYIAVDRLWFSTHAPPPLPAAPPTQTARPTPAAAVAFSPPPHSIAVLPFVNMSGDKEQEYFSEGLTEELLNSLSRINELQVAARTSSFSFQGEHPDISTVAHKLNVGAVLEGSVRRSAHTVRVTTQLINGVTGFHVWSETYDRDLGDVLRLQTEIATAVASALKVTLLGDEAAKIEIGGTRLPTALDAYLRAMSAWWKAETEEQTQAAIDGYTEAIHLDPQFALAYAARSLAGSDFSKEWAKEPTARDYLNKAAADARNAVSKAPDLAEGHLSLAYFYETTLEFTSASQEYRRALMLAPGKAQLLWAYGGFAVYMGQSDAGLGALRRSVTLDPLNAWYRVWLGGSPHSAAIRRGYSD